MQHVFRPKRALRSNIFCSCWVLHHATRFAIDDRSRWNARREQITTRTQQLRNGRRSNTVLCSRSNTNLSLEPSPNPAAIRPRQLRCRKPHVSLGSARFSGRIAKKAAKTKLQSTWKPFTTCVFHRLAQRVLNPEPWVRADPLVAFNHVRTTPVWDDGRTMHGSLGNAMTTCVNDSWRSVPAT